MFVRKSDASMIKDQFTPAEVVALNAAITGQVICPPGVTIDDKKVSPDLLAKLRRALAPLEEARRKAEW